MINLSTGYNQVVYAPASLFARIRFMLLGAPILKWCLDAGSPRMRELFPEGGRAGAWPRSDAEGRQVGNLPSAFHIGVLVPGAPTRGLAGEMLTSHKILSCGRAMAITSYPSAGSRSRDRRSTALSNAIQHIF